MDVPKIEPPCLDPTCPCCAAWRSLDDARQVEIDRLHDVIQTYSDQYER